MTPDHSMRPGAMPRTRLGLALGGAALLVLATATAAVADSPAPASAAAGSPGAAGGNAISIVQKTFQPTTLSVHTGDTVTWTVTDAIADPHSVTSGSYKDTATAGKVFDSGIKLKNNGDSFSFTFTAPGTYPFFCAVHPETMSGTITVADAGGASGGEASGEGPIPASSKVIAGVVLVVVLLLLFGWARIYRRMNPA